MVFDSEAITEGSSAPKLSLFSLPNQSPEPQGMLTPPLRPPASVPFLWEEAPGKPRTCNETEPKSSSVRCLELPPRLLISENKITNTPSPTTVLEGPYLIRRSASFSVSFSRDRHSSSSSSSSPPERRRGGGGGGQSSSVLHLHGKKEYSKERSGGGGYFGSWGRNNTKQRSSLKGGNDQVVAVEDNFVISRSATVSCSSHASLGVLNGEEEEGKGKEETRVKITRFRRRGSSLSLSSTTRSHFWASVYGTLKQVVPWRRTSSSSSSRRNKN